MYRNSAQNYGHAKFISPKSLPSPDNTSDSDVEMVDALDEKRRQLDEEITTFKAAKDREFREFERDLRVNRTKSRDRAHPVHEPTPAKQFTSSSSGTASVLNLLASTQSGPLSGRPGSKVKRDGQGGDRIKKSAPLSGPTLSLDKSNVAGETMLPVHSIGTNPSPTLLKRSRSQSPAGSGVRPITPPSSQSDENLAGALTPTPSKDRSDPFAGVFTPSYLPLLESRDHQPALPSPQPLPSAEEEAQRLRLDAESKQYAETQRLESSHSLPPQQVSPTLLATRRSFSSSVVPSASLPSALRIASVGRTRKHVKFQLADLMVVDPSSSYVEGPSPELEEKDHESIAPEPVVPDIAENKASKKSNGSLELLGKKEKKGRRRNGRFLSPIPSPHASPTPSPIPSPAIPAISPSASPAPSPRPIPLLYESGFSGGLSGTDDGGSGVGFFELDEELASPGLRDGKPVDSFDLDPLDEEMTEKAGLPQEGLGISPSVQVGSVPINIARPSFFGSYGH